jgi:N-acetyl-gamma-glutamyl-phosphate reductase
MIKVGIIGADMPDAGELLRILMHHPEVEIKTLYAPALAGRLVSSCHHGFIGEEIANFTDKFNPSGIDILFIADDSQTGREILNRSDEWPELRIVDMSPRRFDYWESSGLEYGLSEMNRKSLVRGARLAVVPSSPAALALAALYPLASHLLLDSDIDVAVDMPASMSKSIDPKSVAREIAAMLVKTQTSFNGMVNVEFTPANFVRSMRTRIVMKCPLDISEINNIYDSIYDDHSFTHTSLSEIGVKEVEGTHKCVVSFKKPDASTIELITVGDCHIRGGAGDAVHLLNLFFALDEKIGLNMKPSCFGDETSGSQQSSWFA